MQVTISDDLVQATRMSPAEIKQELAILLFAKEKLTLGQAARLAGVGQWEFQHLLASRRIPGHYGVDDFEADLATLATLRQA